MITETYHLLACVNRHLEAVDLVHRLDYQHHKTV